MSSKLFEPITIGNIKLQHRVVLAPLTRFRASPNNVHNISLAKEYYEQRASYPGTLLITEGTPIAGKAGGMPYEPGIWNDEQIAAWKEIADAVHARGSYIFMQIFAFGRAANETFLKSDGYEDAYVAPSAIKLSDRLGGSYPRELTLDEISEYIQLHVTAAKNAVFGAGLDGVEVHGANGYLMDQFNQEMANQRTDKYGGSIENRARFALEVVDAVSEAIGAKRTAFRLSPYSTFQDMKLDDPVPQFSYIVEQLRARQPDLAYLHLTEPRIAGSLDRESSSAESNDFLKKIWSPLPIITAGGYIRESAIKHSEENANELVAFGRLFISNPDLVKRLEKDVPLTPYDRSTFYTQGAVGYIDYPYHVLK